MRYYLAKTRSHNSCRPGLEPLEPRHQPGATLTGPLLPLLGVNLAVMSSSLCASEEGPSEDTASFQKAKFLSASDADRKDCNESLPAQILLGRLGSAESQEYSTRLPDMILSPVDDLFGIANASTTLSGVPVSQRDTTSPNGNDGSRYDDPLGKDSHHITKLAKKGEWTTMVNGWGYSAKVHFWDPAGAEIKIRYGGDWFFTGFNSQQQKLDGIHVKFVSVSKVLSLIGARVQVKVPYTTYATCLYVAT